MKFNLTSNYQQQNHYEIERKFKFDPQKLAQLETNNGPNKFDSLKFLSRKSFTDIYYDNQDSNYPLTSQDIWLRQRDNKWECKTPMNLTNSMDSYHELETANEISDFLKRTLLPNKNIIANATLSPEFLFTTYNLTPFCKIHTTRDRYLINEEFTMDLDKADFGHYVGEIELIVESKDEVNEAEKKIALFMKENDWFFDTSEIAVSKLIAYIENFNRKQWAYLEDSGVLGKKLNPERLNGKLNKAESYYQTSCQ
ncbi:1332_t:CDS:2 [Ambispora leptoticha]|uniref:1332_t:CDS:1 n=1 Tax=Ambispora leptoticha TaxID=144679 RepID=A0A9N8YQ26_9GLOM|nr:1332_t:CDS:2 [Ambispora leptoticha]